MGPPAPDATPSTSSLSLGAVNYNLLDLGQRFDAEYQLKELYSAGSLSQSDWNSFTSQSSSQSLGTGTGLTPAALQISTSAQRPQTLTTPTTTAPSYSASALPQASSFVAAGLPTAPVDEGVPASNYRTLRDTDNRYWVNSTSWIDFTADKIKINYNNRSYLIGTDGADNFDSSYYANYPQWFNSGLLTNFLGGGGNDTMGGSSQSDRLWGGTGDDVVQGYAGDDKVYGEEGNDALLGGNGDDLAWGGDGADELQGEGGADKLLGQAGNDVMFGQVGNDSLWGGEGDDLLMGFTASNEAQQSLYAGQTDNDVLMDRAANQSLFLLSVNTA